MPAHSHSTSRRALVKFLAASPLLTCPGLVRAWAEGAARQQSDLITAAKDGLDVFDFEAVARKNLTPAHFGYLETGTDDDGTIRANREGFARYELRVRRLVDTSKVDMSVKMLGARWDSPILLCPVGSQRAFHPDGELAVARGAKAGKHLFVLATPATIAIEEVTAARGEPVWFQLYQRNDWNQTRQMIKRAEATGCPALVYTIDLLGGSNRETVVRARRRDTADCSGCHDDRSAAVPRRRRRKPVPRRGTTSSA